MSGCSKSKLVPRLAIVVDGFVAKLRVLKRRGSSGQMLKFKVPEYHHLLAVQDLET